MNFDLLIEKVKSGYGIGEAMAILGINEVEYKFGTTHSQKKYLASLRVNKDRSVHWQGQEDKFINNAFWWLFL